MSASDSFRRINMIVRIGELEMKNRYTADCFIHPSPVFSLNFRAFSAYSGQYVGPAYFDLMSSVCCWAPFCVRIWKQDPSSPGSPAGSGDKSLKREEAGDIFHGLPTM